MKRKLSLSCFLLLISLIVIDQITKYIAVIYLKPIGSKNLISNVFEFCYLENRGAAFGLWQGGRMMFLPLTILIIGIFIFAFFRLSFDRRYLPLRILMVVFMAGAIGNFIDRLLNGYVVDFLYFKLINFPIFNMADIYVTCSCIAFFILILFVYKEHDWDKAFVSNKRVKE